MEINVPLETKQLTYYDITFISGLGMPITIDEASGDTIDLTDTKITIYLAPRPKLEDPKDLTHAQHIILFMPHIAGIHYYTKEVAQLTPDQQYEYAQTIKELTSTTIH